MARTTISVLALLFHVAVSASVPEGALQNDDSCSDESCSVELLQRSSKQLLQPSWLDDKQKSTRKCEAPVSCDLSLDSVLINNLDGADSKLPAVIRYANVCEVNCKPIDFVVSKAGSYSTGKPWKNGKFGKFGMVNLDAGTTVNLTFAFVKPGTMDEVSLDSFYFTVFDLDSWIDGTTEHQHESVTLEGFSSYALSTETYVKTSGVGGGKATFTSTVSGGLADNPTDPMVLRKPQAARAASFIYRHRSSFNAEFAIVGPNTYGQRNFMFAGQSPLTTTCPPPPPTSCSAKVVCDLKFHEVVVNNLLGDEAGPEEMRYGDACTASCKKLDLLVTKATPYSSSKSYKNGVDGSMGMLNLDAGTSVSLKFQFVESGTVIPAKVESFHFSVFDIDGWIDASGSVLQQEKVTVTGFDAYSVTSDTQLEIAPMAGGATFTSKASGGLVDNPKDPMVLRGPQAAKSVGFLFLNKDNFGVNFEVFGPSSYGARNFLFSGTSMLTTCDANVVTKGVTGAPLMSGPEPEPEPML